MSERKDEHRFVSAIAEFENGSWEIRHQLSVTDLQDWVRRLADGLDGLVRVTVGPYPELSGGPEDVS